MESEREASVWESECEWSKEDEALLQSKTENESSTGQNKHANPQIKTNGVGISTML